MVKTVGFFFARCAMKAVKSVRARPHGKWFRNPVKLTALLYLKEALLEERFEECPLFIRIAYEFGAQDYEVENLLEDPRRTPRG